MIVAHHVARLGAREVVAVEQPRDRRAGSRALQEVPQRDPCRAASAPTRDGTARPRSAARGGARPSPRRRRCAPRPRARPGRASRRASGSGPPRSPAAARAKTPRPSCSTRLALPWRSRCALPISPPNASTIAWCPRQTPSVGTPRVAHELDELPRPRPAGAGERTRCVGASARLVSVDRVVPAHDRPRAPSSPKEVREVVRERVVVVDEQDHVRAPPRARSRPRAPRACSGTPGAPPAGSESATIPPPACSSATPSCSTIVRIAMHVSSAPPGSA